MVIHITNDDVATIYVKETCDPNPYPDGYGEKVPTRYLLQLHGENQRHKVWMWRFPEDQRPYVEVRGEELVLGIDIYTDLIRTAAILDAVQEHYTIGE